MKIKLSKSYFDDHKGHTIWTRVKKNPRTNRWVFFTQVIWGDENEEFKSFPYQQSYATESEAKREALSLAKAFIDARKPAVV